MSQVIPTAILLAFRYVELHRSMGVALDRVDCGEVQVSSGEYLSYRVLARTRILPIDQWIGNVDAEQLE